MPAFVLLLPVVILFLTAVGIVVLQQTRPGIGYAWLIAAVGGVLTSAAAVFLRWYLPMELIIEPLRVFGDLSSPPAFRIDYVSWPYMFSLAILALAFILTDAARLEREARPINWAAGLALAGLGMLAVLAANPVSLILTWTAVDLVEFLTIMATRAGQRMGPQTVRAFTVRVAGTLLVILSILLAESRGIEFTLSMIPEPLVLYMLLAAGLRLGVLPLNIPYTREVYAWRGLGNVLRLIGPASSLMVLGRMPGLPELGAWKGLLLGLAALAALYGAAVWLGSNNEINGRPFWSTSLAALAVASVINGSPQASVAWGCALILAGSVLFFYSARRRQILYLPLLAVVGISGLPFTPAAAGWTGLAVPSSGLYTGLFFLSVVLLIWGFVRHVLRARQELYRMERWVHAVYPVGLAVLILAQWAIGVSGWPGSLTAGVWWIAAAVSAAAGVGLALFFTFRQRLVSDVPGERWLRVFVLRAGAVLGAVFRLNWLYSLIGGIYRVLQNMVQLLTGMLEGDGGMLWTLVMLALLISIISAGTGAGVGTGGGAGGPLGIGP